MEKRRCKKTNFDKPETLLETRTLILKTQNADLKRKPILETMQKIYCKRLPNGLRYLRWGGDGEAVQPEK